MHKREKGWVEVEGQYPLYAMAAGKISTEPRKNDYAWLMSPLATLQLPSVEMKQEVPGAAMPREKPITQPLSKFAGNSHANKAGIERSITPIWKPKILPRYSSPIGRANIPLAEKQNNRSEKALNLKMHQSSSVLIAENPRKAPSIDKTVDNQQSHLSKNMLALNISENIGIDSNIKAANSTGRWISPFLRSTIPPEKSLITKTGRSVSVSRLHSNSRVTLFSSDQQLNIQLSRVPSCGGIYRVHKPGMNPNVSIIPPKSSQLVVQGPPHIRTGRSSSVSRVHSSVQISSYASNPEPIIRLSSVPSSKGAIRDHKQESHPNVPTSHPQSSEFSDQGPNDIRIGRSCSVSRVGSNAQIPSFTSKPEPVVHLSQVPGSQVTTRDCKQVSKTNITKIPPLNSKYSDQPPADPTTGRSSSVSRLQTNTQTPLSSKPEPIVQCSRMSSSLSVIRDCKQENNPNMSAIPPPNPKFSDKRSFDPRTGRSQSASHVHSNALDPSFAHKLEPFIQHRRVSSSLGVTKDGKQENSPNVSAIPPHYPEILDEPSTNLQTGQSLSVSHMHSNSQIPVSVTKPESIIQSTRVSSSTGITKDHECKRDMKISSTQNENKQQVNRTQVIDSQIVDKFLKARMSNPEEAQLQCKRSTSMMEGLDSRSQSIDGRQSKTKFNTSIYDGSCFSRSISKTSLDMAFKHRDFRRDSSISAINSTIAGRRSASVSKRTSC